MEFDDLRRMQVAREGDGFLLCDNRGWNGRAESVAELNAAVEERDPDVIEGHELFRKILPAVAARAKQEKVKAAWGRDGSLLASRASRIQVAEKTINYPKFEARGRHLVDTFLLAQFWDVGARELEGYELEDVAAHFHLAAGDAAARTRELAAMLSASYFVQAKIFPYNYQMWWCGEMRRRSMRCCSGNICGRGTRFPICRCRGRLRGVTRTFFSRGWRRMWSIATWLRCIRR